jgi:hypothetical protein
LLLIHQLPTKPAYFRVKIWRRLQGIGAVAVKSTVYALPANAETQEDFEWLLKEIAEGGGEAMLCEARLIDGLSDTQVRALFDAARDADYEAIAGEVRSLATTLDADDSAEKQAEVRAQLGRLRKRLAETETIDFFGATGRVVVEGLIAELERRVRKEISVMTDDKATTAETIAGLKGRTWVTRQGVHVDRIACSWLIRRFIDADAVFRFVPGKGYLPKAGELRFDMFEGEFTHEGDHCSFEVLLARSGISDTGLQAIGEIVHDVDLNAGNFNREEATGIAHLIAGIVMANKEDKQRIAQGASIFDNLYQYFRTKRE